MQQNLATLPYPVLQIVPLPGSSIFCSAAVFDKRKQLLWTYLETEKNEVHAML